MTDLDSRQTTFDFLERTGNDRPGLYAEYAVVAREIPAQAVAGIRLRVGTPDAPGVVLYDVPPPTWGSYLIVSTPPMGPYEGSVSFDRLWNLIDRHPVFVEVTLIDGARVGLVLEIEERHDWHCSEDREL